MAGLTGINQQSVPAKVVSAAIAPWIDWDVVLRSANSWYDRLVDATGKPTFRECGEGATCL